MKYETLIAKYLGTAEVDPGPVMDVNNPADLLRAQAWVKTMDDDVPLDRAYEAGDEARKDQTKHDKKHGKDVREVGMPLVHHIDERFPKMLNEWQKTVEAPISLYTHDIGSAIDPKQHAVAGAEFMYVWLTQRKFPPVIIRNICRNIAGHRSEYVLTREFSDPIHAITVVADKCVGDENRVRPLQANIIRLLSCVGLGKINFWEDAAHDRVNFAIKQARVVVDSEDTYGDKDAGAFVLQLDLRTNISQPAEVLELYGNRFHACGRAAGFLGFVFRIEFNGVRYMYHKPSQAWRPIKQFWVPISA